MRRSFLVVCLMLLGFSGTAWPTQANARDSADAQIIWQLLDYIAVDYSGAVDRGRVRSADEYAEMNEFGAQVASRMAALPKTSAQASLVADAQALNQLIHRKAPTDEVAGHARSLGNALLSAYSTPLAPTAAPDLAKGAAIYRDQCSACHGASGAGDGPAAVAINPPPIAFTDRARARERSLFGLYQVIHQGLEGTAMTSFAHLPAKDQWSLAFYVGRFAFTEEEARRGQTLWENDAALRAQFPTMEALTQRTPAALAQTIGDANAISLMAFLRRHPEAIASRGTSASLDVVRERLHASLSAYESQNEKEAGDLALAAYLDGFEPIEPILTARDPALMRRVETAMATLRHSIVSQVPLTVLREQIDHIDALLVVSERALAPREVDIGADFTASFAILLREGVEALLIVVAMIAFLRKAERRDALMYVHGGWIAALVLGGITWWVATYLITISGASRELTEGFGSLIAAAVLVWVGLWMHSKAQAGAWQRYIREKLSAALSRRSAWFLFLLAFLVVYREVFETILFFAALWSQGSHIAMLSGAAAALIVLCMIAWALLTVSRRLPIGKFFAASSLLMATLSVVLAGKGIAALQEAGLLDARPLQGLPTIPMLGLYPTLTGVTTQLILIVILMIGFQRAVRT